MSHVLTRQAILDDLEAVVPLFDAYRQFYNQPSDPGAARVFLRDKFNHGESVIFLAWEGATPVGLTQLFPSFSSVSMARVFLLNDLFVLPSHRRQGVGALLLEAAVQYGRAMRAVRLSLTTNIANVTAQATYEAQGWKRDEAFYAYHFVPTHNPVAWQCAVGTSEE
jgi:GNAT superfamily N-acetyltransferase